VKQSATLIALIIFIAAVSFVLASEQEKQTGRSLTATLTGAAEVPGPGDPDGTGQFKLTLNPDREEICYELTVAKIGTATAAHIHTGAADAAGPVLVPLKTPVGGSVKDCVKLDREKLADILKNPANYYVNVHNADFPNGAIRGQLAK
jgi:hypothetical protein